MAGMRLTGRDEAGPQSYTAWFTTYPSTHERAGQTVEVVARWVYEALAEQHAGAVDDVGRLRGWITHLDTMTNDPRLRAACASALRGDAQPAGGQ